MPFAGQAEDLHWSIELVYPDRFLLVNLQGPVHARSWLASTKAFLAAALACQCPYLLVNHRASPFCLSTLEVYEMPELLRTFNPPTHLTAAILFPGPSVVAKFMEDCFSNTPFRIQVFYSLDQAKAWLLSIRRSQRLSVAPNTPSPHPQFQLS